MSVTASCVALRRPRATGFRAPIGRRRMVRRTPCSVREHAHALHVEEYDADDVDAVEASRLVLNAANAADAPFLPQRTLVPPRRWTCATAGTEPRATPARRGRRRAGRDGRRRARRVGQPRRGLVLPASSTRTTVGRATASRLAGARARAVPRGRPHQVRRQRVGVDRDAERSRARHGFVRRSQEIHRVRATSRSCPPGSSSRRSRRPAPYASDYELVRCRAARPTSCCPQSRAITAAINDAPLDDLDIEDEVFPRRTDPRLRDRVSIDSRAPALPDPGPAPGDRRARRTHGGGRGRRDPDDRSPARHGGDAQRTAAIGSGCCSRPR